MTAEDTTNGWTALVQRCSDLIQPVANAFVKLQDELGLPPVAGSQYAADIEQARHGSKLLGERAVDIGVIVASKLLVGYGHLYAVADSLNGPGVIFAPWTLLRTVVEALGIGVWIVKADSLEGRVQRTMSERLHGIDQVRRLGNDAEIPELVEHADTRIASIQADSESLEYLFKRPDHGAPYVGTQRESAVRSAGLLFGGNQAGALIYRRASEFVHGSMSAVVTRLGEANDAATDALQYRQPQTTPSDIAGVTRLAVFAGLGGMGPILDYLGYGADTWKAIGRTALLGVKELAADIGLDRPGAD